MKEKKELILLIIVAILTITVSVESVILFIDRKKENNIKQENSEKLEENNNKEDNKNNEEKEDNTEEKDEADDLDQENQNLKVFKKETQKYKLNGEDIEISYVFYEPSITLPDTKDGEHYNFSYDIYIKTSLGENVLVYKPHMIDKRNISSWEMEDINKAFEDAKKKLPTIKTFKDSSGGRDMLLFVEQDGYNGTGGGYYGFQIVTEYGNILDEIYFDGYLYLEEVDASEGIFYELSKSSNRFYITDNKVYYGYCGCDGIVFGNTLSIHDSQSRIESKTINAESSGMCYCNF